MIELMYQDWTRVKISVLLVVVIFSIPLLILYFLASRILSTKCAPQVVSATFVMVSPAMVSDSSLLVYLSGPNELDGVLPVNDPPDLPEAAKETMTSPVIEAGLPTAWELELVFTEIIFQFPSSESESEQEFIFMQEESSVDEAKQTKRR
jgi:hypothetical protein